MKFLCRLVLVAVMSVECSGAVKVPQFNDVILIVDTRGADEFVPDSDALLTPLSQGVAQKCAPIIVAASILKKHCLNHTITAVIDKALKDSTGNWFIFKNKKGNFYLLVPGDYLIGHCAADGNVVDAIKKIGFNVGELEIPLQAESITVAADVVFKLEDITEFFRQQDPPTDEINKLLQQEQEPSTAEQLTLKTFFEAQAAAPKWLFYWMGHGSAASAGVDAEIKPASATIAGLEFKDFTDLIKFFNENLKTKFIYHISCFAGGYNMAFVKQVLESVRPQFFLAAGSTTDKSVIATADDASVKINEFFKALHTFFAPKKDKVATVPLEVVLKNVTEHADETSWYNNAPFVAIPGGSVVSAVHIDDAVFVLGPVTARKFEITGAALDATKRSSVLLATDRFSRTLKLKDATLISILEPELSGGAIKKDYVATHYFECIESPDNTFDQVVAKHFLYGLGKHPKRFLINKLVCKKFGAVSAETEEYDDVIIEGKIPGNVGVMFKDIKTRYGNNKNESLSIPFAPIITDLKSHEFYNKLMEFMVRINTVKRGSEDILKVEEIGENFNYVKSLGETEFVEAYKAYFEEKIPSLADEIIDGAIGRMAKEVRKKPEKPEWMKAVEDNSKNFNAFKKALEDLFAQAGEAIKNNNINYAIAGVEYDIKIMEKESSHGVDSNTWAIYDFNNFLYAMGGDGLSNLNPDTPRSTLPKYADLMEMWNKKREKAGLDFLLTLLTHRSVDQYKKFNGLLVKGVFKIINKLDFKKITGENSTEIFSCYDLISDPGTIISSSFSGISTTNYEDKFNDLKNALIAQVQSKIEGWLDVEKAAISMTFKTSLELYNQALESAKTATVSDKQKKEIKDKKGNVEKKLKYDLMEEGGTIYLNDTIGDAYSEKIIKALRSPSDAPKLKPFDDYIKAIDAGVGAGAIMVMLGKKADLVGQLIGAFDKTKTALGKFLGALEVLK